VGYRSFLGGEINPLTPGNPQRGEGGTSNLYRGEQKRDYQEDEKG